MPETEAPVAPNPDETQPPADSSELPEGTEQDDAAAAAQAAQAEQEASAKRERDRRAEEGRERKRLNDLALQQAQQIQNLTAQVGQLSQFANQQQQADLRNRLANMSPEDKIDYLTEKVLAPPAPLPAPQPQPQVPPEVAAMQERIAAHLAEANQGLDDPITGNEPELAAENNRTELQWLQNLAKLRLSKEKENEVPAKPATPSTPKVEAPLTRAEQQAEIDRAVARATGVQRSNAAQPRGAANGGASIQDMNNIVANRNLGPAARLQKLQELTPGT